jgi:peptide deformylase
VEVIMAKLEVLRYPNSILRKKCDAIENIDEDVRQLARDMLETMYEDKGIGLAAPQVGITRQLIVLDIGDGPLTLINPKVVSAEGSDTMEEGCLCLPGINVDVERSARVRVTGLDAKGAEVDIEADELLARALQHEIDHLSGTLIIDKVSKLKRDLLLKKYKKAQQ